MDTRHIAIVVQGLFEKSDSIGYDAVFQYKTASEIFGRSRVALFAERFDPSLYPGIDIRPVDSLWTYLKANPSATLIYHYCDGWPELDAHVARATGHSIVRWHNNTPPWFYGATHRRSVERTIKGFRTIVELARNETLQFWVNSNFTLEQLRALGGSTDRSAVVFPGSPLLDADRRGPVPPAAPAPELEVSAHERPLRLLFVSRVVAHKGHRHVISLAAYLQQVLKRDVSVTFIGRDDPASGFKAELEHLGRRLDVEVLLEGEVPHEQLRAAYLTADVFICFSEHEGFGMPVFEAMRLGVPVLCWGRTALKELMQQHPFTLDDLDFPKAAAAIELLEDKQVRRDLLAVQRDILESYTAQVVAKQLTAAMSERYGPWPRPAIASHAAAEAIAQALDAAVAAKALPRAVTDAPRDFGDNYVTLHDIESYEAMLEADRGLHHLPERPPATDSVLFSHREFFSPAASRLEEGIAFSGIGIPGKAHVVYGPYARFVRGYFSADFGLEAETSCGQDTELELDVVAEGGGVLAARRVTVADLHRNATTSLFFPVATEGSVLEFRIRIIEPGNCNFLFKGVTIRNMRQSIADLPETVERRVPAWLRRKPRRSDQAFLSPLARPHFRRGDALRDRAWWNDAAAAYADGLKVEPRAFAYLVQLGNCLKEARRFAESEDAYQRALALRANDRDVNLQLGRLYRQWGNLEAAHHHLLIAARLERAAAQAMHELAATGFDISALPDLFD